MSAPVYPGALFFHFTVFSFVAFWITPNDPGFSLIIGGTVSGKYIPNSYLIECAG